MLFNGCMTLRTTPLKSELTICTTGEGVRWLWACQQRVRRSVRRTVTASAMQVSSLSLFVPLVAPCCRVIIKLGTHGPCPRIGSCSRAVDTTGQHRCQNCDLQFSPVQFRSYMRCERDRAVATCTFEATEAAASVVFRTIASVKTITMSTYQSHHP